MRIAIISPPLGKDGKKSADIQIIAPPVLEYLAILTQKIRPDIQIDLINANKEEFSADTLDADVAAFSALTPYAPWAYKHADIIRKKGIKVIIGGMHVTALPEEGKKHADSIIVGEAESVWQDVLMDAEANKLLPFYYGERLPLDGFIKRDTGLLKSEYRFDSFFTARGCPYRCTFCSVRKFFGDTVRYRPIEDVIRDVAASPKRMLMNLDDNIWGVNINRSIEMYKEMANNAKGKRWFGQADLITVQHKKGDELLKWAKRSGLTTVMVGWESENPGSLEEYNAETKQGKNRIDAIKKIKNYGIDVILFIMVGGRSEGLYDYKRVIDLCDKLSVCAHPVMLMPYPGTELYEQYKNYLIPDIGWDRFDGSTGLFYHDDPEMTPENREVALLWLWKEIFTWQRILKSIAKISLKGFPMAHFNSLMFQWAHQRAFREYTGYVLGDRKEIISGDFDYLKRRLMKL